MAPNAEDDRPLHDALLDDEAQLLAAYDQAAQDLVSAVRHDGYFDDLDAEGLVWPGSQDASESIGLDGLTFRARLVHAIYRGLPAIRDARLDHAYAPFRDLISRYHDGNRIYLQLKRQFVERGNGDVQAFLKLYQSLYVDALAKGELFSPEGVEAELAEVNITQVPMSHAQAVAEALAQVEVDDDPRWNETYAYEIDGKRRDGTLRDVLQDVAQRTLHFIAAGGLLSTRYHYLTNFGWFGASVWKVVVDADVALFQLREVASDVLEEATRGVLRLKAMLIEFWQAHRETPTRLRPNLYWYGQEYSYLTRDMADLACAVVRQVNGAIAQSGHRLDRLTTPPLLMGQAEGRFVEYPQVGRRGRFSKIQRIMRFVRWTAASLRTGRQKKKLLEREPDPIARRDAGWQSWLTWGRRTLDIFGVQVSVKIDPQFDAVAGDLHLEDAHVIFLPTHQSLFDHPLMYKVLQSPEFMQAMRWKRPEPCVILARTGLARSGIKIGAKQMTQFGMSSEMFDRVLEEVDGYVMLERSNATGHTTQRVAQALAERPGIIYPMATTASFPIQLFPLQHGVFAQLPQDVVIVPIALRGIHALWPKCPKGNIDINPGQVEVWVSPPMLGETTLLPKRRSLRIQAEAAALFQAVHIATLLNPEPSDA